MSGRGLLLLPILLLVLVLPTLLARCYESEGTRRQLPPRERKRAQRCCCVDGTNGLLCPTDGGGERPCPVERLAPAAVQRIAQTQANRIEAMRYLACRQAAAPNNTAANLENTSVAVVKTVRAGAGFGSLFQRNAMLVTKALVTTDTPVSLVGDFGWYSNNKVCQQSDQHQENSLKGGYECYFEPILVPATTRMLNKCNLTWSNGAVPSAVLYGAVQSFLLRPNERVQKAVNTTKARLLRASSRAGQSSSKGGNLNAYPGRVDQWRPDIALHMRFGDKQADPGSKQAGKAITAAQYLSQVGRFSLVSSGLVYCAVPRAGRSVVLSNNKRRSFACSSSYLIK